ncbi:hypothetical protein ACSTHX_00140, partial [Vibrio parahaemolyticus]
ISPSSRTSPTGCARASEPKDFSNYVSAALSTLIEEGERGRSAMLSVGFHLRICGRPARFRAVKAILSELAALD